MLLAAGGPCCLCSVQSHKDKRGQHRVLPAFVPLLHGEPACDLGEGSSLWIFIKLTLLEMGVNRDNMSEKALQLCESGATHTYRVH